MNSASASTNSAGAPQQTENNSKLSFAEKVQLGDLFIKFASAATVIISGWIAFEQFNEDKRAAEKAVLDQRIKEAEGIRVAREKEHLAIMEQRKRDQDAREKEYQIRFFEQKMLHYAQMCDAAARITAAEKIEDSKEHIREFDILYWGKVCIFESADVVSAENEFYIALVQATNAPKTYDRHKLRLLSVRLGHACKDDILKSFKVDEKKKAEERPLLQIRPELLKQMNSPSPFSLPFRLNGAK